MKADLTPGSGNVFADLGLPDVVQVLSWTFAQRRVDLEFRSWITDGLQRAAR